MNLRLRKLAVSATSCSITAENYDKLRWKAAKIVQRFREFSQRVPIKDELIVPICEQLLFRLIYCGIGRSDLRFQF